MKNFILAIMVVVVATAKASDRPDPRMNPGATNPAVAQQNIQQTICVKGYTKTIRPPVYYTNKLKKEQIRQYGYSNTDPRSYEEDHIVPLSLGGAPLNPRNLWPQPRDSEWSAEKKDQLEFVLYKMVCANELSLVNAQRAIAIDWIAAWRAYVPNHQSYRFKNVD